MEKTAIIIGATGLVGSALLQQILKDDDYAKIKVLHRRSTGVQHTKLEEHIIDFDKPEEYAHLVKGDVLFSALGTTKSSAGSKEAQYKVDYTYQFEVAKAAAENGVLEYVLVSSAGADSSSYLFYSRMKGELEDAVKELNFKTTHIFQPSILDGDRKENRVGEKIGLVVMRSLTWVPYVRKYRPIKDEEVAAGMRKCVKERREGVYTYVLDEIFKMA